MLWPQMAKYHSRNPHRKPQEPPGTPRNPREPPGTPRNPREPRGTPRNHWVTGYGLRVMGYGLRFTGYGLRVWLVDGLLVGWLGV